MLSRRGLLSGLGVAATAAWLPPTQNRRINELGSDVYDGFPKTPVPLAAEIVGAAHVDLEKVQRLIKTDPSLARASVDWGFGDWETALGAAAHMGRQDIAELLLAHGAPPTLFSLAATDQVDAVRSICQAIPDVQKRWGPHGITLLKHAVTGKADRVVEYLRELGGADEPQSEQPLDADAMKVYIGKYDFGQGPEDTLEIGTGRTNPRLGVRRGESSYRFMAYLGEHHFTVFGSPHVDIEFDVTGDQATAFRLKYADTALLAQRLGD
jgi:hypothetical protein